MPCSSAAAIHFNAAAVCSSAAAVCSIAAAIHSNAAAVCSSAAAISKGFIEAKQRKLGAKALVEFSGRKIGE